MADAKLATRQEINSGSVGDYIQRVEQGRRSRTESNHSTSHRFHKRNIPRRFLRCQGIEPPDHGDNDRNRGNARRAAPYERSGRLGLFGSREEGARLSHEHSAGHRSLIWRLPPMPKKLLPYSRRHGQVFSQLGIGGIGS